MYSPGAWAVAVRAAPAKKRRLSTTKPISSGTVAIGLPTFWLSTAPRSSACSSIRSARRQSASARSAGGVAAQPSKAAAAASTARSTSSAVEDATSAITSPVAGSSTGSTPPPALSRQSPPMKFPRVWLATVLPFRRRLRPILVSRPVAGKRTSMPGSALGKRVDRPSPPHLWSPATTPGAGREQWTSAARPSSPATAARRSNSSSAGERRPTTASARATSSVARCAR